MKIWRHHLFPKIINCNNSQIIINIMKEDFKLYGNKYELAEHIIQEFLNSGLQFQNYYFFALERKAKGTRLILYNNPNQEFIDFSIILKKYLDNYLFA